MDVASTRTACAVTLSGAVPVQLEAVAHEASVAPVQVAANPEVVAATVMLTEAMNNACSFDFMAFLGVNGRQNGMAAGLVKVRGLV